MLWFLAIGLLVLAVLFIIFGSITIWIWMDKFGRNLNSSERLRLAALEAELAVLRELTADPRGDEPPADE